MTFGVIERQEPLLAELIALAFESAGHDCLVFDDVDYASHILDAIHIDSIVLDIQVPGGNGIDWLEAMVATRPDLPSRTLLLTPSELTPDETARVKKLGAEVALKPRSVIAVERVVIGCLQKGLAA